MILILLQLKQTLVSALSAKRKFRFLIDIGLVSVRSGLKVVIRGHHILEDGEVVLALSPVLIAHLLHHLDHLQIDHLQIGVGPHLALNLSFRLV